MKTAVDVLILVGMFVLGAFVGGLFVFAGMHRAVETFKEFITWMKWETKD